MPEYRRLFHEFIARTSADLNAALTAAQKGLEDPDLKSIRPIIQLNIRAIRSALEALSALTLDKALMIDGNSLNRFLHCVDVKLSAHMCLLACFEESKKESDIILGHLLRNDAMRQELRKTEIVDLEQVFQITCDGKVVWEDSEIRTIPRKEWFRHSPDFTVVTYNGVSYSLRGANRIAMQALVEANGKPVTMDTIRAKCEEAKEPHLPKKMHNVFTGRAAALLGQLIVTDGHGWMINEGIKRVSN